MLRSLFSKRLVKFVLGLVCALPLISAVTASAAPGAATSITTLSLLSGNVDTALRFGARMLTDVATISGLALFFLAIFNLYTSHTKQASGGKPMSHGLVMLACGALLIALPYVYNLVGNTVMGHRQIGSAIPEINGDTAT